MAPLNATIIGALIVVLIASITDIRTGKIYNKLTLPAVLIGLIVRTAHYAWTSPDAHAIAGIAGFLTGFGGFLLGLLSLGLFKLTIMRKFGGGDIKLMAALGAFVGPGMIIATFMYYCFFFSLYTCGAMAAAFPWQQAMLAYQTKSKGVVDMTRFNAVRKAPLPVAPFIAAGLLMVIIFYKQTGVLFGLQ